MHTQQILLYLKTHGEQLDTEIAAAVGLSLNKTRVILNELAASGDLMSCYSIRYENGKKIEGMKCRIAGYIPPATPGRKSKAQLAVS